MDEIFEEVTRELKGIAADVTRANAALTKRMDDIEKKVNRSKLAGMGGGDDGGEIGAEHKALALFARRGDDAEIKAMSVGSDPDGGYLVLPVMAKTMITKLFDATPMRRLARVETITSGDAWEEPIDGSDVSATWVAERDARPVDDNPQVGMLRVPLEEIYAHQQITQRLLDDSGVDLGGWVQGKIDGKFARAEGTAFVAGNGIKKPRGFLTHNIVATADAARAWGDLQYLPSGDANLILADALRSLVWGLRSPYRAGASWLMNSNTAGAIDKLKDGNGDYLWRNSSTAGAPDTLLGYSVEISEDMPDVAANAYPIAFGNFELGYLIVDRAGVKLLRDPYTSKPNVLFYVYKRVGGDVANSEAIKLMKVAAS